MNGVFRYLKTLIVNVIAMKSSRLTMNRINL